MLRFTSTGLIFFGLEIHWYGALIALGMALGVALACRRAPRLGLSRDTALDLALLGIPAAILGARLYYVAFAWQAYAREPIRALFVWEGGLAIYGGLLGGLAAGLLYARAKRLPFLKLCDLAAPSFALGQAVGRWGNFINQEAYGIPVARAWQRRFPVAVYIPSDGLWHCATFFYESVWCLIIVWVLLSAERRGRLRRSGSVFWLYTALYALERAWVEGLRTDSLTLGPLRVSQGLSLLALIVCGLIALARAKNKTLPAAGLALAAVYAALLITGHMAPALIAAAGIFALILTGVLGMRNEE